MVTLSVVIISFNEADIIEQCLQHVTWADEIIVVDSESTDGTIDIARRYATAVHEVPWLGFGPQKNHAIDLATCDWILCIDCDEFVSERLAVEIRNTISSTDRNGFKIRFKTHALGRPVRFGNWWMQHKPRLFRRGTARFRDRQVHERLDVNGPMGRLRGKLEHHTLRTRKEMQYKLRSYAALGGPVGP